MIPQVISRFFDPLLAQCLHTVREDNASAAQHLCGSSDMKTLEKSLMADGTSSDMLLLKVLTAGKRVFLLFAAYYLLKSSDND